MSAYYNEIEPYAAAWLRNLISNGHIAPGEVDERDIRDVSPSDLVGFTQCHFFAGIGVWSYALRQAGWSDDRPVWTGSCPCQPFSAAGAGEGFADERHLWPAWNHLIEECRPPAIFGEQVASKAAGPWIDLVHSDLEGLDYAFGCVPFPSAGVGAPHIRDRNYWVAYANSHGRGKLGRCVGGEARAGESETREWQRLRSHSSDGSAIGGVDQSTSCGCEGQRGQSKHGVSLQTEQSYRRLADAASQRHDGWRSSETSDEPGTLKRPERLRDAGRLAIGNDRLPSPTNGFWGDVDWLFCRDGKWRPTQPGLKPLVNGASARVGRLRAYGNAINAEAAIKFIQSAISA